MRAPRSHGPERDPCARADDARRGAVAIGTFATVAVIGGEVVVPRLVTATPIEVDLQTAALVLNVAVLASVTGVLLAATNRLAVAIHATAVLYLTLTAINLAKLRTLQVPLRPIDVAYIPELASLDVVGPPVWTAVAILAAIAVALGVRLARRRVGVLSGRARVTLGVACVACIAGVASLPRSESATALLERVRIHTLPWDPQWEGRRNGLLLGLTLHLHDLVQVPPPGYGPARIRRIVGRYEGARPAAPAPGARPADLIVYMVESLMDPLDLGVELSPDPIPVFRGLARAFTSGFVVPPVFGGLSANTEFELFTGMTTRFMAPSTVPYKQYLGHDVPSLPWQLKAHGYRTLALLEEPAWWYGRRVVYGHLGIDRLVSLSDDPTAPRGLGPGMPSDEALVDAIIAAAADTADPLFVFAFSNETHLPWTYPVPEEEAIEVRTPLPPGARDELRTYATVLRRADRALGRLVDHFAAAPRPTMIVVLGDHRPAFSEGVYEALDYFGAGGLAELERRFRAPLVVWSNVAAERQQIACGTNFLAARILRMLGIRPDGFLAANEAFAARFRVLSPYVETADGRRFLPDAPEIPDQEVIADYRLLQYDLLHGQRYAGSPRAPLTAR